MDIANITLLLSFSLVIQLCSLLLLYLMAENVSALLKSHMIAHYEKIANWKYGGDEVADSTVKARRPIAV